MAADPTTIKSAQYEALVVTETRSVVGSIVGETYMFTVREIYTGVVAFTRTPTITSNGSTTTAGVTSTVITTALTGALSPGGTYEFDLWRTNSGTESRLVYGPFVVEKQVRL